MDKFQQGILDPVSKCAKYMFFSIKNEELVKDKLFLLKRLIDGKSAVLGIGLDVVKLMGAEIDQLHDFPDFNNEAIKIPSTPYSLWIWLKSDDEGELFHHAAQIKNILELAFSLDDIVRGFDYQGGHDLSGFKDGTANPVGGQAENAAIVTGGEKGITGSSFVAIQKWLHDFEWLEKASQVDKEKVIGRSLDDDHEFEDALDTSHLKRTDQESFAPEAFMVRRSMPWSDEFDGGLMFVCFGSSLYSFEAQMKRMAGLEDDKTDGLFKFSRPITGSYFWCPPFALGRLDLSFLGV